MNVRFTKLSVLSFSFLSTLALAQNPSHKTPLSINDVAILMPYSSVSYLAQSLPSPFDQPNPAQFAPGQAALPLDGKAFISQEIISTLSSMLVHDTAVRAEAGSFSAYAGNESLRNLARAPEYPESYKFVAMRVDPCANLAQLGKVSDSCQPEVRVTWQAWISGFGMRDASLHSIHSLDKATFTAFVNELRAMRAQAGAGIADLRSQPDIADGGVDSPYLKSLVGLMHRYLRSSNLSSVAFHDLVASQDDEGYQGGRNSWGEWAMAAVSVKNGVVSPASLPVEPSKAFESDKVQRMFIFPGNSRQSEIDFEPSPLGKNATTLFPKMANWEVDEIVRAYPIKYKNAHLIQNPQLHNRQNTDCVSCHVAEAQKAGAKKSLEYFLKGEDLAKALQVPEQAYKTAVKGATKGSVSNFHMFGITSENRSSIMPGTVNDASLSLQILNQL